MNRVSIIAIEEVCKRCHLYTKHCGMLDHPSECVQSGHFIDGYRKAEKDLALTPEDVVAIVSLYEQGIGEGDTVEDIIRKFKEQREKK